MTSDGTTATGGLTGITADTPGQEAKAGREGIDSILTTKDEVLDADGTPVEKTARLSEVKHASGAEAVKEADTAGEQGLVTRAGVTGTGDE
ncbi:hypothetical protein [Deinococcus sp. Leaf326]|uniref:hypothetical protein n=1 Tax=Deinococcus sp. Leaf326 TaxID=1736338 RepID=UPI0006F711F8|nr:hypothetical protein [Deinococcus sp. Leaf326]KQR15635.1 hypothetical protein ASF71_08345 [Deinococcus sp. Leaf326]